MFVCLSVCLFRTIRNSHSPLCSYSKCGVGVLGNMGKLVGAAEKARTNKDATVDVYWLSDDGGLCLLMAYLITQHPAWKNVW